MAEYKLKAIIASQLKRGDKVFRGSGIMMIVAEVKPVLPECLAQVQVEWEGGKLEKFCNFTNLQVKEKK